MTLALTSLAIAAFGLILGHLASREGRRRQALVYRALAAVNVAVGLLVALVQR
jgi:hypothetical protein